MVLPLSNILILANMRLALSIASLVLSAALDAGEKESVRPDLEAEEAPVLLALGAT